MRMGVVMMLYRNICKHAVKGLVAVASGLVGLAVTHSAYAGLPDQRPLFLVAPVKPILMLAMPKEQQLFYKLYNDYTDLSSVGSATADGKVDIADTTYNPVYEYYGYFDNKKCYTYVASSTRFEPSTAPSDALPDCTGTTDWSGNFLNWATMTRIDAIRKILYGGFRVTDTASTATLAGETVLERAFLPNDAHSFAKYYAPVVGGSVSVVEMKKVVPDALADATGVTFCNTTDTANRSNATNTLSQNITEPPLMKAAKGNYSLWAANERWQCGWKNDPYGSSGLKDANNSNNAAVSLINAETGNPSRDDTSGYGNYVVRVQVCKAGFINTSGSADNEKCYSYEDSATKISTIKPRGLLHIYGENDSIYFGLVSGSYTKNKSGGVLRKAARSFKDEVSASNGVLLKPTNSIVKTLDLFRIYGYRFDDGTYSGGPTGNDDCPFGLTSFADGVCTNWGNPQAEIYLETLRYLAGKGAAHTEFTADDTGRIPGLTSITTATTAGADWADPISNTATGNYCTPLNILQFNASMTSYDADSLDSASSTIRTDVSAPTLTNAIDQIASFENLVGDYFVGETATASTISQLDGLCTAKTLDAVTNKLSTVRGICPEAPNLEGSYAIAGLAYLARKYGVGTETTYKRSKVKTFGVALASALPKAEIVVPGSSPAKKITIIPACRNDNEAANCAIVDFKVTPETTLNGVTSGQLYVNWEAAEQGGDYDQDMWGVIQYSVSSATVSVTTRVLSSSSGRRLGFGYVIGGTTTDGFKVDSGINDFTFDLCNSCKVGDTPAARTFAVDSARSVSGSSLELPLYYAAKWGGWNDKKNETTKQFEQLTDLEILALDPTNRTQKGTYYYATEPKELEAGLNSAFADTANIIGSASTVAANSTSIQGDTRVYQARFDSSGWTGQLISYPLKSDGSLGSASWNTDTTLTRPAVGSGSTASNSIPTYRRVFTAHNSTPSGNAVQLSSIDDAGVSDLKLKLKLSTESDYTIAEKRFNWLLGSAFYEGTSGGLRIRTKLMGDVINSDPGYAGGTSFRYDLLPPDDMTPVDGGYGAATYQAYVTTKTNRTAAVFVGANDGMLHAFNAATGQELFAYIPRAVYSKLADLTSPNYTHSYTVDGPVYVNDVFISPTGAGGTRSWRTIVTGTMGNGGAGAYALDVTDVLDGTSTIPRVIFDLRAEEVSGATAPNSTLKNDLGYSQSKILILPAAGEKWIAVWGNGTNSVNGYSRLLAVDIETPSSVKIIDTQVGSTTGTGGVDNGLSGVAFLPSGTGLLAYAYAGDLFGNMWKFDLTASSISSWNIPYSSGSAPAPLIKVLSSTGTVQPITSTPTLGRNALKLAGSGAGATASTMIYFGTGKYGESADNNSKLVQSIYGIADSGSKIALTTSNRTDKLHEKTIATQTSTARTLSGDANTTTGPAVAWTGSGAKDGWFLDLKFGTANTGERVLSKPLLLFDRVIVNTFIPSSNPCDFGGSGWLMELVGVGDVFKGHSVLGVNANNVLDRPIIGDLLSISAGEKGVILGSELGDLTKDGGITIKQQTAAAGSAGRMSWRQLK